MPAGATHSRLTVEWVRGRSLLGRATNADTTAAEPIALIRIGNEASGICITGERAPAGSLTTAARLARRVLEPLPVPRSEGYGVVTMPPEVPRARGISSEGLHPCENRSSGTR
jgi:hypothetical protein